MKAFVHGRKVYARPSDKFEKMICELYNNYQLDSSVTNSVDGQCEVEFYHIESVNATRMHPTTGEAPFWHSLVGKRPDQVRPVAHVKKLLTRKARAGDHGATC